MIKFLYILLACVVIGGLSAPSSNSTYRSALLESRIWELQLSHNKQCVMEMESRNYGRRSVLSYDRKRTEPFYSYSLCKDTVKVSESGKKLVIRDLTDSTLALQCLPDTLTVWVCPVRCVTDNSLQEQRENENRLDSTWRADSSWNFGTLDISGKPIKDLSSIEQPRWAKWDYDLEKYFTSQMVYPEHLLEKNQAGYAVVIFSIDTLGLPRGINILSSKHKDFAKEVVRLTKALPHCLPCRDKDGKRMECLYTVYVPFLPQHYRDRVKADSIAEERKKHMFIDMESGPVFQYGRPRAAQDYITRRLKYDPTLLGDKQQVKGVYSMRIDSYGEVCGPKVLRSCGMEDWDNQEVYDQMVDACEKRGVEIISDIPQESFVFGDMTVTFFNTEPLGIDNIGENENSLGVLVEAAGKKAFLSGDINNIEGTESAIKDEIGKVDLLNSIDIQ